MYQRRTFNGSKHIIGNGAKSVEMSYLTCCGLFDYYHYFIIKVVIVRLTSINLKKKILKILFSNQFIF